jgi:protein involved in polysaccharide export with SLBB domain
MSNLTEEDTAYFKLETRLNVLLNSQTVDMSGEFNALNSDRNPVLRDGDIVVVPKKETAVYVLGQVLYPGGIKYKTGEDMWYYIKRAGGLGELAETDDIMIIKSISREWLETDLDEPPVMQPGDYIWIPRDTPHSFNYYVREIGTYLGIVGSAATIILLLIQFGK